MDIEFKSFASKPELYEYINAQLKLTLQETEAQIAALANVSALLMLLMPDLNWAGFYVMKNGGLVLGPFQGKPAVAHIAVGAGVCGTAVKERRSQLVEDVHSCCNHIACDFNTSSELVVPIFVENEIFGVIDLDSPSAARFDADDRTGLERVASVLGQYLSK